MVCIRRIKLTAKPLYFISFQLKFFLSIKSLWNQSVENTNDTTKLFSKTHFLPNKPFFPIWIEIHYERAASSKTCGIVKIATQSTLQYSKKLGRPLFFAPIVVAIGKFTNAVLWSKTVIFRIVYCDLKLPPSHWAPQAFIPHTSIFKGGI